MPLQQERQLDVTAPAVKRLLTAAVANTQRLSIEEHYARTYWDGYIRALEVVLEMENE
jgi:hypothetical protein